ncbi:DNA-binding transcriptional regulator, PucR family [Nocardia amikacinitolerans]|nr:DNA-binding transcriptional regulator, PucR family [Nocardia amikacinitolerans]
MQIKPPRKVPRYWEPPSERIAELIRTGVGRMLDNPKEVYRAVDEAVLSSSGSQSAASEPGLLEALLASIRANFSHWATANFKTPGMPVTPNLGPENVDLAREFVRHGFDSGILTNFHAGQNAAVQTWTTMAFELTSDPDELRELIAVVNRSIFAYIDDTLAALYELIDNERGQNPDVDHAARMEAVELVLQGAPISLKRASQRIRYDLGRRHLAAVVWTDDAGTDPGPLERAVTALAQATGSVRPLTILASSTTMWVWVSSTEEFRIADILERLDVGPGARVAIGSTGAGLQGFRRSHLDAVTTQRLMRRLSVDTRIATYDEIEVVALATADMERAMEFVGRTLGSLATDDPELRETLRMYLRVGSSTTHAAKALFAHRNTIVNRLERARGLLPQPLEGRTLQVALALEIMQVIGGPPSD